MGLYLKANKMYRIVTSFPLFLLKELFCICNYSFGKLAKITK